MSKLIHVFVGASLLVMSIATPMFAQETKVGSLVITQPWSRATPGGAKVAAGYLTIENKGSLPDRLKSATSDVAGKVELHDIAMSNNVMTMRPVDGGLPIEPGKIVKLAPGGLHLMLLDIKSPLKVGDKAPVTIEFEKAGKVTLSLDVQGVGANGPADTKKSGQKAPAKMEMKGMHDGMKM